MVILIPNSQFNSIYHIFETHQYLRNVIEAIPELITGELWVDSPDDPTIALFSIPGIHILAGTPDPLKIDSFLTKIPEKQVIFVPRQEFWVPSLKRYFGGKLGSFNRYDVSASSLTLEYIQKLKKDPPEGYQIQQVDVIVLNETKDSLGSYILLFFGNQDRFLTSGKGYCIKKNDTTISMASSLVPYKKSLEVQVDTLEASKYRRKGFATQVAVELIEYCLESGIEPHWDADTEISRDFALKLGYTSPHPYKCYYWVK